MTRNYRTAITDDSGALAELAGKPSSSTAMARGTEQPEEVLQQPVAPGDAGRDVIKRKKRRGQPPGERRRASTKIEHSENNAVMQQYEYLNLIGEGAYAEVLRADAVSHCSCFYARSSSECQVCEPRDMGTHSSWCRCCDAARLTPSLP